MLIFVNESLLELVFKLEKILLFFIRECAHIYRLVPFGSSPESNNLFAFFVNELFVSHLETRLGRVVKLWQDRVVVLLVSEVARKLGYLERNQVFARDWLSADKRLTDQFTGFISTDDTRGPEILKSDRSVVILLTKKVLGGVVEYVFCLLGVINIRKQHQRSFGCHCAFSQHIEWLVDDFHFLLEKLQVLCISRLLREKALDCSHCGCRLRCQTDEFQTVPTTTYTVL